MSTPYANVFDSLIDAGRLDAAGASLLAELVERLSQPGTDNPVGTLARVAEEAGYGREVRSWIGAGQPLPLPPDGIERIAATGSLLDEAWLAGAAQRHGIEPTEARRRLGLMIPMLVKTLTPRGEIPSSRVVAVGLEALKKRATR